MSYTHRPTSSPPISRDFASFTARASPLVKQPFCKHPAFDNPDADLVLRTVDKCEFRVFRRILIESSDIFRDMFSIPEPSNPPNPRLPVLDLPERAPIFNDFLICIYPLPKPKYASIEELRPMFDLGRKYASQCVLDILRAQLVSPELMRKTLPLRVYALACREDLPEEKRISAAACLDIDIDKAAMYMEALWSEELRNWSALDLTRLIRLRDTRFQMAAELVRGLEGKGVCSVGNCRHDFAADYFPDFQEAALMELRKCPTSKKIFSHSFIVSCLNKQAASCLSCAREYMASSGPILTHLRRRIDALPDNVLEVHRSEP